MAGEMVMMLAFVTAIVVMGIFVMIITPIRDGMVIMLHFPMCFDVIVCDHTVPRCRSHQWIDGDAKDQKQAHANSTGDPRIWSGLVVGHSQSNAGSYHKKW